VKRLEYVQFFLNLLLLSVVFATLDYLVFVRWCHRSNLMGSQPSPDAIAHHSPSNASSKANKYATQERVIHQECNDKENKNGTKNKHPRYEYPFPFIFRHVLSPLFDRLLDNTLGRIIPPRKGASTTIEENLSSCWRSVRI